MNLKSKLFAGAVGVAMVLGVAAPMVASAQTTAELTAQINSLLAMIAQLQAQIAGGTTTTGGSAFTFTKDLTIGSTGAEVSALQDFLVSKGVLTMPAGVAKGYFGALTKNALVAYQTSAGITPASGYFGPITRAKVNASGTTTGGTTTGGTTTGGITTPGVEGTLSVTSNNSGLVSTVYAGDSKAAILGFNVEAKTSDIAVQRIKLDLGDTTKFYNDIYSKLYVTDGSNVLASTDLNSNTVVKSGGRYYVTITGFNFVVPKNTKKQIVIKADLYSSIDSADYGTGANAPAGGYPIALALDGVRGVDGAGIDQYDGSTSITRTPSISDSLADTATLKVSLNNSSPKAQDVVASDGSQNNELDKLTLLSFDLKSEKDEVTLQDLTVDLTYTGGDGTSATATTIYLYDGSTELDNASVSANSASFTDLGFVIPKDSTKTLTVKADIRDADETTRGIAASVTATKVTAENSRGDTVDDSGSATGYAMSIRNVGIELALVSKSITTNGVPQSSTANNFSTSTLTATFNVKVKAVGNDVILGTVASTTKPLFAKTDFVLYKDGVKSTASVATSTSFTIPDTCTTIAGQDSCTLAEGSEVTFPVTFQIPGRTSAQAALNSGIYAVGLEGATWGVTHQTSTFMAGQLDWRTADVSFP